METGERLYALAVWLYGRLIGLLAGFNGKARLWSKGRRDCRGQIRRLAEQRPTDRPVVWMHCASLGEFEQGRPVLEYLRRERPGLWCALSFYSPSGYEVRKQYAQADWIGYLPEDLPRRAEAFVEALRPELVLWVKYDWWHFFLKACFRRSIPVVAFAVPLDGRHIAFHPLWGPWHRRMLRGLDRLFVQREAFLGHARRLGLARVAVADDPRIDRVRRIEMQAEPLPEVERFLSGRFRVLILGSAYARECQLSVRADWSRFFDCLIVAPHRVSESHIQRLEHLLGAGQVLRYSRLEAGEAVAGRSILMIDRIGLLSRLYRYGSVAFVGNGWGKAIHNSLEPAAFALPVTFGPAYTMFPEAVDLVSLGAFFPVEDADGLAAVWRQLSDGAFYQRCRETIQDYMHQHEGGSRTIGRYALQRLEAAATEGGP